MRANNILSFLAIAGLSSTPTVFGWGAAGHEIVATIAQIHLHPSVLPTMCNILNFTSADPNAPLCHLAPVATWADRVRFKMRWSAALHYIGALDDYPSETCLFPGRRGWAGRKGQNVLGAIRNVTGILEDWFMDDSEDGIANEALKFLAHFLGDMHMPLHLTGRDRGGNSNKVLFDGRVTNLHSLWDGLLIAKGIRTIPSNYTRPLPSRQIEHSLRGTIYDPYVRRIMWEGILGKWQDEVPGWLACPAPVEMAPTQKWQQVFSLWEALTGGGISQETDDDILCPHAWAQPIHQLNCDIVWPKELDEPPYKDTNLSPSVSSHDDHYTSADAELEQFDSSGNYVGGPKGGPYLELDTPEYWGVISEGWIVEKLLAKAGIRLAGVLNLLFAEEGDEELRVLLVDL